MHLGISSFTYGWAIGVDGAPASLNEQGLIAQTVNFGLTCLQIGDNLPLHTFTPSRLSALHKAVQENNIRIEVGARGLTENYIHQYIDIAASLQSPLLRFVIDNNKYEPEIKTIVSIIKNFLSDLKKHKITLGIENHDRLKAVELRSMMEEIADEHVGICLDTVNSIGAGEGLEWVTEVLAPYTVNLHIKDFSIRRFSHNMGFTVSGTPAGKGMMNLPAIIEKLSRYNRCQSAVLEQWVIPADHLEETITKEKQWAAEGIQFLKVLPYFKKIL